MARYTVLNFLPLNLFQQFSRIANLYFALIAILQLIPGLAPTSWVTTVIPLGFVLSVNIAKELYDDYYRHREDLEVNSREVEVLRAAGEVERVVWKDLRVGDVVRIGRDQEVPADLVLLASEDEEGICYAETANLDGETNLKLRRCCHHGEDLAAAGGLESLADRRFIECDLPNERLYEFQGALLREGSGERVPLDESALLLRGSTLRKTAWAIGVVVYAGSDTKIQRNSIKAPRKVTRLERTMNLLVVVIFVALMLLSLFSAVMEQVYGTSFLSGTYYLEFTFQWPDLGPGFGGFLVAFLRFIILYNQLIPISLYVSLEVVKVVQCFFLNNDLGMYHAPTGTRFHCRTTTLNEELGQVKYVLSDKTGTLTENVMSFVWCSIGGEMFGRAEEEDPAGARKLSASGPGSAEKHRVAGDAELRRRLEAEPRKGRSENRRCTEFVEALAICNGVYPHWDGPEGRGSLIYQAESADEEALVEAAAELGARLLRRTTGSCVVEVQGRKLEVTIGAVFGFTSDRKRMSVVGRLPNGTCRVWCKGADNVVLGLLGPSQHCLDTTQSHLEEMSCAGFRTLCVGQRDVSKAEYNRIVAAYEEASSRTTGREAAIAEAAEAAEAGLTLLGATAVEDKLQEGVGTTVEAMLSAGLRVWVLTGDKLETAISIAVSCSLFTSDMPLVVLRGDELPENSLGVADLLGQRLQQVLQLGGSAEKGTGRGRGAGLVVDGAAMLKVLTPEAEDAFLALCRECHSVVCCRVSPRQKAKVTELVKAKERAITLAVGDGANDVGMIQAAHIGCGISGREGRAAVLSSDFSFAQFRFLRRLLLVHGHWSFRRNEQVVFYAFYKNIAYVLGNFYFSFLTAFSAQPLYDSLMIGTYNLFWTSLPTVIFAFTEQVLSAATLEAVPELYADVSGMRRPRLLRNFALWAASGLWHSLAIFWVPTLALGADSDVELLGAAVYTAAIITVNFKISLITRYWTVLMQVAVWPISVGLWFPILALASFMYTTPFRLFPDLVGVPRALFMSSEFWLGSVLLAPTIAVLPDLMTLAAKRAFFPSAVDLFQEAEDAAASREGRVGGDAVLPAGRGSDLEASGGRQMSVSAASRPSPSGELPTASMVLARCGTAG
mmetsp:Transcript_19543/g.46668  ORF Transcript_19543/g.46668 Transcript_19543/m.46668 type:complete len:1120 (-) Transcript_19543:221-3580(-)